MVSSSDLKHGDRVEVVSSTGTPLFKGEIEGFPYHSNEAIEGVCDVVLVKASRHHISHASRMRFERCKEVEGCYQVPITYVKRL